MFTEMARMICLFAISQDPIENCSIRRIVVFNLYLILVVFPFMKPVLQLVTRLFLRSSTMEQAEAAVFIAKTAKDVIHLRRESGVSQVCL